LAEVWEEEEESVPLLSVVEEEEVGVVPLVGIVGLENRLKLRGLPLVVIGLDVVLCAEELPDGVDNCWLSLNLLEPPPPNLGFFGASVVELVEEPFSYSYSPSSYSSGEREEEEDCVGVTAVA
jgi:hypothetical protein